MTFGKTIIIHNAAGGVRRIAAGLSDRALLMLAAAVFLVSPAWQPAARAESAVSVLCYHTFIEKKKMDPYSFTIDELSSHIMQLRKEGFRFVSVGDIIGGRITGTKNVLISIDDGNKSVYEAYYKVFRPNGIRPLLGIYPNIIMHKKKYALTWEQLKELANGGCDIAAHGYFHLKVNRKLHEKEPKNFRKEIFLVKKVLEENLGRKIALYVYPFGLRDEVTISALKEAGYRYAFTIDRGRIDVPFAGVGDRRYELPRYMVTRTSWSYCFDRVMKNARPKVSYRVAASDARGVNRQKPSYTAPYDAAVDPSPDQVEWIYSAALLETGLDAGDLRKKEPGVKKKIVKNGGTVSTIRHAAKSSTAAERQEGKRVAIMPAGRDAADAGRASPVFDPVPRMTAGSYEAAPVRGTALADQAETGGAPDLLSAGMEKSGSVCERDLKARFNDMTLESSRAYHAFIGMVKEKIERLRNRMRRYAASSF